MGPVRCIRHVIQRKHKHMHKRKHKHMLELFCQGWIMLLRSVWKHICSIQMIFLTCITLFTPDALCRIRPGLCPSRGRRSGAQRAWHLAVRARRLVRWTAGQSLEGWYHQTGNNHWGALGCYWFFMKRLRVFSIEFSKQATSVIEWFIFQTSQKVFAKLFTI